MPYNERIDIAKTGSTIGAVAPEEGRDIAAFEYEPSFRESGIKVAPLTMPLSSRVYSFPKLSLPTFRGLPGLLADSHPDRFGNLLIDAWLASQGRAPESFNAVEGLCYTGARGMGALEFKPATGPRPAASTQVQVDKLVELASEILSNRNDLRGSFAADRRAKSLRDILRIGTSAGGARAKAVIAWNPETIEVRSGEADLDPGFQYWLLKFDGVTGNKDKKLEDPKNTWVSRSDGEWRWFSYRPGLPSPRSPPRARQHTASQRTEPCVDPLRGSSAVSFWHCYPCLAVTETSPRMVKKSPSF